jgi:hypothetical protein
VRGVLVPVTVSENVAAVVEEHDTVAVPEPVTVFGVIAPHVNPVGTVSVKLTIPANPFTAVIVIVEVADAPLLTAAGDVAAIVKSLKLKVAEAECVSDPLVPVTPRTKVPPADALQETVAVPEPVTLAGVTAPQASPNGTVSARATTPANPFIAVMLRVDVADWPALTAAGELAASMKLTKVKVAVVECVIAGVVLVPVIVSANVPALAEVQDTVAVPDPVTLLGVIAPQLNPVGLVKVSDTTPAKPPTDVIVIVDDADPPPLTAAGEVAPIVKSWAAVNVKVAVIEWVRVVLVPVTVRT